MDPLREATGLKVLTELVDVEGCSSGLCAWLDQPGAVVVGRAGAGSVARPDRLIAVSK